jgi:hypothetical protein
LIGKQLEKRWRNHWIPWIRLGLNCTIKDLDFKIYPLYLLAQMCYRLPQNSH